MKKLSMTPNAIKKRRNIENPIKHVQGERKNSTLCKRSFLDPENKFDNENPNCTICSRIKRRVR